MAGRKHEPMPRMRHTAQQTCNEVLVHGGVTKDYSENTKRRLSSVVEVFDVYTESWQQKEVTGEAPAPGAYATASASVDDDLFTFGGYDGSRYYNSLHRLKRTSQWIELCPQSKSPEAPMAKDGAEMVAFSNNLAVFGGYGIPHGPTQPQPGSLFIRDNRYNVGAGWTNEFHIYSLKDDVWISPNITGEIPPPCVAFTLTSIDNRRAVLFGGRCGEQGRRNDVYIVDLQTMHWTKLHKSGDGPWPEVRSFHAACCLNYGQQHPQLLVTGGLNRQGKALEDAWVLDVDSGRWRKVSGTLQPRWAHSTTAFCLVDGVTEVTMFGGTADPWAGSEEKQSKLADTTLLQFCCSGQSEWELVSITRFSKLGSEERVSVKKIQREERERQMEKRLRMAEERVQQAEQQDGGMGERAQQAEARAEELERRLEEERRECKRLAVQLEEKERMLQQTRERIEQERERVQCAEVRAKQAEERVRQAEMLAADLQRRLDEGEERKWKRLATHHQSIAAEQRDASRRVREERKRDEQQTRETLETVVLRLDEEERREQERTFQSQGESMPQERWDQQAGDLKGIQGVEGTEQQERERSHPAEWQIQQAELLIEVAEARANSLQWRLSMTEGREQERLELQQPEREMQQLQASERAQQAEERVQRAENRVQKEIERTNLAIAQWKVEHTEFLAQLSEARATSLQWRVGKAEEREQERLSVDQLREELEQVGEWARNAEERVQGVEERVQRIAVATEQKPVPIRGADIVAKTSLEVVPGTALTFEWIGHGMKLHMPAKALEPDTPTQNMTIQASLSGQYQLPDDTELVSGIYWVAFPQTFSQPVTMELQHCAYLEHPDQLYSLSFLTAKCNQKTLPYHFRELPGGVFSLNTSCGTIELNHFSGVAVGMKRSEGKGRGGIKKDKEKGKEDKHGVQKCYIARVFYIPEVPTTWLMHFMIVCDLELYLREVEKFYEAKKAEAGPYLDAVFDNDEVVLDIPKEETTLPSGWAIQPLVYPPRLMRRRVDSYRPGRTILSCQVELVWKEPAERLFYMLRIRGLRPAETYIKITRNPSLPDSQQSQPHASTAEMRPARHDDTSQLAETQRVNDFRQFGKPMVSLLMNLVGCSVKNKWRDIGSGLGLKEADLTSIQAEESGRTESIQNCMRHVFKKWESAMTSEYTWQNLANVLNSPAVNEKAAVLELHKSLCKLYNLNN